MVVEFLVEQYTLGKYTLFTTLVNVVLGLGMILSIYWIVNKKYIPLEVVLKGSFAWALLGISTRVIADVISISMPYKLAFITPFIYVEVFLLSLISYFLLRKREYVWYYLPIFVSIIPLALFIVYANEFRIGFGIAIIIITYMLYILLHAYFKDIFLTLPVVFQFFDGLTTFIATTFLDFYEEQLFAATFISMLENAGLSIGGSASWAFMLLKLAISWGAVMYLRKSKESKETLLVLWFIAFLGFVTGLRNMLNIVFV